MKSGKRIAGALVGGVILLALASAGAQLWNVHQMTSDWTLWPKAVPSKVQFANRDYDCGPNPAPVTRSLDGFTRQGKTAGGADIYAPGPGTQNAIATWIAIRTDTATYSCDLLGGP